MFSSTVLYLLAALLSGWLGFGTLAGHAASVAKLLCAVFLVLFVVSLYPIGEVG